jgi:hypothetical protein
MANHKRGRPKQQRAGCLLCKPHKLSSAKKAERRRGRLDAMLHELRATRDARLILASADDSPRGAQDGSGVA